VLAGPTLNTAVANKKASFVFLPIGIAIGTAVGVATANLALWLSIGVAVGAALTVSARRRG